MQVQSMLVWQASCLAANALPIQAAGRCMRPRTQPGPHGHMALRAGRERPSPPRCARVPPHGRLHMARSGLVTECHQRQMPRVTR